MKTRRALLLAALAGLLLAAPAPAKEAPADVAARALRRLASAVRAGVTFADYSRRVADTRADVDEALRTVPAGAKREAITAALTAYQDAGTAWGEMIQIRSLYALGRGHTGRIAKKYGVPASVVNFPAEPITDPRKPYQITRAQQGAILSHVWGVAEKRLADVAAPPAPAR